MSTKFWVDNKLYLIDEEVEEYFQKLDADIQRLQMIIKAVKEWAVVDFNESLLGFIRETEECKSAEEIENKLGGDEK